MSSPRKWDEEFDKELFTPEEIEASDRRVDAIQHSIEGTHAPDREKVIKGLECCMCDSPCNGCPYWDEDNYCDNGDRLKRDALALLKVQEPRVMTIDEVKVADYAWLESQNGHLFVPVLIVPGKANIVIVTIYGTALLKEADYNMQWRCWTSCPTDEQREATPWVKT